ncbi:MAG: hypothetical protein ACD_51C00065G0005 [uncultured bacterium]|nr:MAG: hypothetical protein ACD_51C00065G0005 [uncultured bacterium]OGJ47724.1 MAG: MBL fold metallo-hydrolase [Candidatus Peregrinibacteria bacterium RIFOXYA2_FULL_41_18]OGJ49435.1 MAG: MBL fold metallo-hydrolase [Candidatus Peregrinibacteria bacterium RIFOXYB12_FULL_41_12]OGJ52699.1 MAG: MBL fold metallo-hydrolase [Candidatus Peregrinibacteria bacterium RIFOXYC2_FULL_41_22]
MQFVSYGAAREVTGSKHMFVANGKKVLFDCGSFQGRRDEARAKNEKLPFNPSELTAVVLSHAHIDHSGNLPTLVKQGFKGPIYCTAATKDLCDYMLRDSAFIQEKEAQYINEKKAKKGEPPIEPLYTEKDADDAIKQLREVNFNEKTEIYPGFSVTFREAGHILGAALIEIEVIDENAQLKKIVFTGDLGRKGLPLLRDPYEVPEAEILITESTYGNRLHESFVDAESKLAEIINKTAAKGGKLIIPAFALERTQEIVYSLNKLSKNGKIPQDLPVYVDSPLAVNVTEVFKKHKEFYDQETLKEFVNDKQDPFSFARLTYITSVDDSKALNNHIGPCIIISASGMCEFGRILHHLRNNIEDHRNTVLIVGYMAENTLGRKLLEKERKVNIFGKPYEVNCTVEVIDAYSAHADRSDLLSFATHIKGIKKVFLVHGEEKAQMAFKDALTQNGFKWIQIPQFGEVFEL